MNIREATKSYEAWLAAQTKVVRADLDHKHKQMSVSAFAFLRATYYRWLQRWPEVCPKLVAAPQVLAVGDVHVENFGTWRDVDGRLVWGINDLDEAHPEPYTLDLVRLATSAHLAIIDGRLQLRLHEACQMILNGYSQALQAGGQPYVLEEEHVWLRGLALSELRDPVHFWERMERLRDPAQPVPADARKLLREVLPEPGVPFRLKHRVAGLGSLGRQRLVALADYRGGYVAREAKALLPSARVWIKGDRRGKIWYETIIQQAVRVPDPFVCARGKWILRRLAPDCSRIELVSLPKLRSEDRLLRAMGWETANVHLGSKRAIAAVKRDLRKRGSKWLHIASKDMAAAVLEDWKEWRRP